jgi:ABC-type uncharacterized transport system permease subunit
MKKALEAILGTLLLPFMLIGGAIIGFVYGMVYACLLWNFNMNNRSGFNGDWELKLP